MNKKMYSWKMTKPGAEFELVESSLPSLGEGEALIQIAGCGVCHTDLSFWHYGVKTKKEMPLTLGHEISGRVIDGPPEWVGKKVIIPAVLPCGECELCKKGRNNICRNQLMPGNDFDGGFASHIKVPARYLCPVSEAVLDKYALKELAVVADAISTPYQVVKKSGLEAGDLAIVIGVGGVGIYAALIAKIFGAKVLALDIDDEKLKMAKENGIDATLNVKDKDIREIKSQVRAIAKELNVSKYGWKIFEISGTKPGQELGFSLITFASVLSIVGFTMEKPEVRLSNLMAFDAALIGTWGCKPELYPEVLELVESGKLNIAPFIELFPMSRINEVFKNTLARQYKKRSIMVPDFE
ncbi:MAG TPA: 6-hydroxycyclohex-1-ene-1-carbonyl-CoA dehydrogenase [Bacteroidetes bacterium]|nr:6-hydroxycyclohex-1-ene-1-carbonyl-CoA dehydrogenase [Bacteroidota bacterium]